MSGTTSLLLEIGCEELPASFIRSSLEQLATLVPEELGRNRIPHGAVHVYGTPRRLAVRVEAVGAEVPSFSERVVGPAESIAKDAKGWTRAAEAFAKKNDVAVTALAIEETPKGRYVVAEKVHQGGSTKALLPDALQVVLSRITFAKSMRWSDNDVPFGRPIRWIVALLGSEVLPLEFIRSRADKITYGHRFLSPNAITLENADAYATALASAHVVASVDVRRARMLELLEAAAKEHGGVLVRNHAIEEEVLGLVEEPFVITGRFQDRFLDLPEELIETVMSHHQRYFAVRSANNALQPLFLTVTNTALDRETIRRGNERVMQARLSDARFFVDQDRLTTLEDRLVKLEGVVFHPKLGSYAKKIERMHKLATNPLIAQAFSVDAEQLGKAARLSKADLVSLTVGEFPELQGYVGRDLAKHFGASDIADALAEQYMPRGAEDALAPGALGAALGTLDRLDALVVFFAIGQKPSGAGDPFGLRRATLAILRTLLGRKVRVSIAGLVRAGLEALQHANANVTFKLEEVVSDVLGFVRERLEGLLSRQYTVEVVRAAMASGSDDIVDLSERIEALESMRHDPALAQAARAFERVFNISREAPAGEPDASKLTTPSEKALLSAFEQVRVESQRARSARDFGAALRVVAKELPGPIDVFFREVMVMDENPDLRGARLRMMRMIAEEIGQVARLDTLPTSVSVNRES